MNINTPTLIVLVGPPASGKSTYIGTMAHDSVIISTDDIVETIAKEQGKTYSEVWKTSVKEATKRMYVQLDEAIKNRKNVIWDQTNLTAKKRKEILSRFPKDYHTECVYFMVDQEELLSRLKERARQTGKNIPIGIVINMIETYEIPDTSEGFNRVRQG